MAEGFRNIVRMVEGLVTRMKEDAIGEELRSLVSGATQGLA
jgi:hypothetical protein